VACVSLRVLDRLPAGLLETPAEGLLDALGGPVLLHLDGVRRPALFASVLLHGDETTGWVAVQRLLRRHAGRALPRALSVFVGNVAAARAKVRRLPDQPDWNRVWPPDGGPEGPEAALAREVVGAMRARGAFASVDLHNNSGWNPHYACVDRLEPAPLHLAGLFSRTVVHFTEPRGVQLLAFSELCPAVTVECGRAGEEEGHAHAAAFLEAALHLSAFPQHAPPAGDLDLFHTVATVKVPPETSLSFDGSDADLIFRPDLDHLNFSELEPGTPLARVRRPTPPPLHVPGADGSNRWERLFSVRDGVLRLERRLMPAMLTCSVAAVRADCLCYLMERLELPG
jgi:hypothetical protein